jgi:alpha-glucuronidase
MIMESTSPVPRFRSIFRIVSTLFLVPLMLLISLKALAHSQNGEDGYRLWMKYDQLQSEGLRKNYRNLLGNWKVEGESKTADIIREELTTALSGLLGHTGKGDGKGRLLITTSPDADLDLKQTLAELGNEGYLIKHLNNGKKATTLITANSDVGLLYGTFHLLRLVQTEQNLDDLDIRSLPGLDVRILNHWDNLDRHVERGYAGESIWDWHKLPLYKDQRYYDYARANASIGINGTVLNNVNADPLILTPQYLEKVAALADIFRPYGIKVYVSVKFSSPNLIGGLPTSDPLDADVRQWWKDKAAEIYKTIPDFGGFLVKANSEGQPGPGDFGRTHAQGANMLAEALEPHGGIVMWRAFVYEYDLGEERSKQAYSEFQPLDGKFHDNVLVQVKNGPIDFQPREPISPLFGAMPETPLMMEFQITQEYLGFSTHLVYLGTLFEEVLKTDTYAKGEGSTVARVIDGTLYKTLNNKTLTGMAGVANIGGDRNWTGHIFGQSNWYVFGRMAWDPEISAAEVAEEWARMTLTNDSSAVDTITDMMMASRETLVNYMTPLGLHHIMGWGHHYGPAPWVANKHRDDWTSVYYHQAGPDGIGKDRTKTGSNAVAQYFPPLAKKYSKPETTPEELLLWFHHLPWDYTMDSGNTLWQEIVYRYYTGAEQVKQMEKTWGSLKDEIDPGQFRQVEMSLDIQVQEAQWWRDACVLYFQQFSGRPIPKGLEKPEHSLEYYKNLSFPHAPGSGG